MSDVNKVYVEIIIISANEEYFLFVHQVILCFASSVGFIALIYSSHAASSDCDGTQ